LHSEPLYLKALYKKIIPWQEYTAIKMQVVSVSAFLPHPVPMFYKENVIFSATKNNPLATFLFKIKQQQKYQYKS